ncbi:2723_t:CDS:1, partial [Gigaspora margarita]
MENSIITATNRPILSGHPTGIQDLFVKIHYFRFQVEQPSL